MSLIRTVAGGGRPESQASNVAEVAGQRRRWVSLAGLLFLPMAMWSLSSPLFSNPDESAHVIRAESVVRGQFEGRYVGYHKGRYFYPYYSVDVPGNLYYASDYGVCLALLARKPASACHLLRGPTHPVQVTTYVGAYPPLYYLLVGTPTLASAGKVGIFLMRLLGDAICAGFLASAFLSALTARRGRVAAVGVLAALTPTALYVSSGVNPSGLEIASAISLWAAGLALTTSNTPVQTSRFVRRAGLAAAVLVWTRGLSPLWLLCIVATVCALLERSRWRSLSRRTDLRAWSVIVGASTAGALVWDLTANAFQFLGAGESPKKSNLTLVGEAFGHTWSWVQGTFGDFGLVDHDTAPTLLLVLCLAVLGMLIVFGFRVATRRQTLVLIGLIATAVILPVLITFAGDRKYGDIWQGRYAVPLAAGIPLLAALLVANSKRSEGAWLDRRVWLGYVALLTANVVGLITTLHRFIDGSSGPFQLIGGRWQPPVNVVVVIAVFVCAQAAACWCLYRWGRPTPILDAEGSTPCESSGGRIYGDATPAAAAGHAQNHPRR